MNISTSSLQPPNVVIRLARTLILCIGISIFLGACASAPQRSGPVHDPFENINRKIFSFNQGLDSYILRPVASGYKKITPDPVEKGVSNFFANLDDVTSLVNNLLQGRPRRALSDTGRFVINSTVGVLGIFDIATDAGLPKYNETFGQTFGIWGFAEGPFVMLPFFGPANVRATAGRFTQAVTTNLTRLIDDDATRWGVNILGIISIRADLLSATRVFDQAALDPYLFLRDAWVRQNRIATFGELPNDDTRSTDDFDDLDDLDELDELDDLDELDEVDGPDVLNELDELDDLDDLDELDELDQLDGVEQL